MDETLRSWQREAAAGDPAAQTHLEEALKRLGRDALRYTGPLPPRDQAHRGPRQLDRAESTAADCYDWCHAPDTRRQASARAFSKRRRRRAIRRTRKITARDWDLWG